MPIKLRDYVLIEPKRPDLDTWNNCPRCGKAWKDDKSTPGIIHRTILCSECYAKDKDE